MVLAVVHDLKLDTTVPGNVWIAGNIIGRLVECYYIGGIGLIFQIMHTICSILYDPYGPHIMGISWAYHMYHTISQNQIRTCVW